MSLEYENTLCHCCSEVQSIQTHIHTPHLVQPSSASMSRQTQQPPNVCIRPTCTYNMHLVVHADVASDAIRNIYALGVPELPRPRLERVRLRSQRSHGSDIYALLLHPQSTTGGLPCSRPPCFPLLCLPHPPRGGGIGCCCCNRRVLL